MAGYVYGVANVATGAGYCAPAFPPTAPACPTPVPTCPIPCPPGYGCGKYHANCGAQTMQGDLKQDGTFKGHGTGAKIMGGFDASGNIC